MTLIIVAVAATMLVIAGGITIYEKLFNKESSYHWIASE